MNDERGVAVVETALLGALIFAFLVQLVVLLAGAQRAAFAATAAAREAGRAVVLADGDTVAAARAHAVVEQAARNHGLDPDAMHVSFQGAVVRGGAVDVTVATRVPLVRLPGIGAVWPGLSLPVEAHYRARVDRFRRFDDAG